MKRGGIIGLIGALTFSTISFGQNKLIDRDFWKKNPKLSQIETLVAEGNDPAELNKYSFDPLVWALLEGADDDVLDFLLAQPGNSVNKLTHDGRTYVFWAAYGNNLAFMKRLHDQGADMSIIDEHGYSLLTFAAVTGNTNEKIYDFIVDTGANPKTETNRDGANSLLLLLPFLKSQDMITYFVTHGLSLKDTDKHGASAAHYASKGGNIDLLKSLKNKGVDYKTVDSKGRTTAHYAAMSLRGHKTNPKTLSFLKEEGVDLKAKAKNGQTALSILAQGNAHPKSIKYLIENGSDVFEVPSTGRSAFMSLTTKWKVKQLQDFEPNKELINMTNDKGETAVLLAAKYNDAAILRNLVDNGGELTAVDFDNKPIQEYILEGYSPVSFANFTNKIAIIAEAGLDFNGTLSGGNTLFHWVVKHSKMELLAELTPATESIDALNGDGLTALHLASMTSSDLESIQKLLAIGASKDIITEFGETALDLALQNEQLVDYKDSILEILK